MQIQSLSLETDLLYPKFQGEKLEALQHLPPTSTMPLRDRSGILEIYIEHVIIKYSEVFGKR